MRWFETALVLLTLATGLVWLADTLFMRKRRLARGELLAEADEPWIIETARSFFPVLAVVLVLRSFIAEPFRIPSGSMIPSLEIGDFILVNKFAYGLRLPITNTKIVPVGEPRRGDVVVFKYPGMGADDPLKGQDYVKRVVGLPGDTVGYHKGVLSLNGTPVRYDAGRTVQADQGWGMPVPSRLMTEALPGHAHPVLVAEQSLAEGETHDIDVIVPAGHYFMMGDNRDNSQDSRFWGVLPESQVRGRAFGIWMHWGPDGLKVSRIGHSVP